LGGCDGDEEETAAEAPSANPAVSMSELEPTNLTTTNVAASTSSDSRASDAERIQECKDRYQDQIDQLDQQMRSGYSSSQSDGFRERRRRLRQQKRDCQD
jgi:hypothetical protein